MKKVLLETNLPVTFLREGDLFVAYTPALDLSTSGKSLSQARERFVEIVKIFFEECLNADTLGEVLSDLGWKKRNSEWNPPTVVAQDIQMVKMPLLV